MHNLPTTSDFRDFTTSRLVNHCTPLSELQIRRSNQHGIPFLNFSFLFCRALEPLLPRSFQLLGNITKCSYQMPHVQDIIFMQFIPLHPPFTRPLNFPKLPDTSSYPTITISLPSFYELDPHPRFCRSDARLGKVSIFMIEYKLLSTS